MKNVVGIFLALVMVGCQKEAVQKPENLIPEDKMVDILYDLALLDALQSQKQIYLVKNNTDPDKFVYKKHNIDSLQFAKSNIYYASDIEGYKKLYEKVARRLERDQKNADSLAKKTGAKPIQDDLPRVE